MALNILPLSCLSFPTARIEACTAALGYNTSFPYWLAQSSSTLKIQVFFSFSYLQVTLNYLTYEVRSS
jgi:hypothetical protein